MEGDKKRKSGLKMPSKQDISVIGVGLICGHHLTADLLDFLQSEQQNGDRRLAVFLSNPQRFSFTGNSGTDLLGEN